jgi:hypothetical protein
MDASRSLQVIEQPRLVALIAAVASVMNASVS